MVTDTAEVSSLGIIFNEAYSFWILGKNIVRYVNKELMFFENVPIIVSVQKLIHITNRFIFALDFTLSI